MRNKKGGLFLNRKDRVISHLREVTARQIRTAPLDCTPLETEEIARSLQLDRANVSKLLNELWNEGEALKVQGRPILYLSLRTLQAAYPDSFFPSTLPGIAELRRLLQSGAAPSAVPGDVQPDTLPDFLRVPLEGALSACAYPPYGLPLLLTSASQEDVHRLVQLLFDRLQKQRPEDARLISIDCRGCLYGEKSFLRKVFGVSKEASPDGRSAKSCFELSGSGLVHLEGIQRLPDSVLEMLLTAVDRGSFCRIGETAPRPMNATLVCSLPARADQELLNRLRKHFPCRQTILSLDDRGLNEKLTLLSRLLSQEATGIHRGLVVEKNALAYLLTAHYPAGVSELRNTLRQFCAAAFSAGPHQNSMELTCAHLPPRTLFEAEEDPGQLSYMLRLFSLMGADCVMFTPGSQELPGVLHNLLLRTGSLDAMPESQIFSPPPERLLIPAQYIQDLVHDLAGRTDAQLTYLQSWLPHYILQQGTRLCAKQYDASPSAMDPALSLGAMLLMQGIALRKAHLPLPERSALPAPGEDSIRLCRELFALFAPGEDFALSEQELAFFSAYLAAARRFSRPRLTGLLLLLHGNTVATEYAQMIRERHPGLPVGAIDLPAGAGPGDIREKAAGMAESIHRGEGILLLTDVPAFLPLAEHITQVTCIPCRALWDLSFTGILSLAEQCSRRVSLNQLAQNHAAESQAAPGQSTSFMQRYFRESYTPDLCFLDPEKSFRSLSSALNSILEGLGLPFTHEIAIKFLAHSSHMIERVISSDPLNYPSLRRFLSKNGKVISVIQKHLEPVANTFGITLPASEIAYLAEIFLQYM